MATWIGLLLLHGLYWGLGATILRRFVPRPELLSCDRPHWFAAYFLGLVPNLVLAFAINQFLGLRITLVMLMGLAFVLFVLASRFPMPQSASSPGDSPQGSPWSWREYCLCGLVAAVWTRRHELQPLSNWDAFMYHLPLANAVRDGHFPAEIGRSYIMQLEAAYPPLFYFQYGLNAFIKVPDVTYLAPQLMVTIVNGLICVATYHVARQRLGASALCGLVSSLIVALVLNVEPNVQSITTLYVILAIYYSWDAFWMGTSHRAALTCPCLIAAIFWGGAYWCSYLGLPIIGLFFVGLAVAGVWSMVRGNAQRLDWARVALASGVVALLIVPHTWRNWLVIGNPLYPAFLSVLGGSDITDWFLAHRPPAAYPIEAAWKLLLQKSVLEGTPMIQIILAGATALLLRGSLLETRRVLLYVMMMGFLGVLFQLFHLYNTPWARYLYPLVPLASAVIATHAFTLGGRTATQAVAGTTYLWGFCFLMIYNVWHVADLLIACLIAVMFGPPIAGLLTRCPRRSLEGRRGAAQGWWRHAGGAYLSVLALIVVAVIGKSFHHSLTPSWFGIVAVGLILTAVITGFSGLSPTMVRRTGVGAIVAVGIAVVAVYADWGGCIDYELPIDNDVKWMNENLSPDDAVMLFDGRVALHLKRKYVALDDVRLEPFDKASTHREAMKELERLGITHLYFSHQSSNLISDSIGTKQVLLHPTTDNKNVELLYRSKTGWIARLRHEQWSSS